MLSPLQFVLSLLNVFSGESNGSTIRSGLKGLPFAGVLLAGAGGRKVGERKYESSFVASDAGSITTNLMSAAVALYNIAVLPSIYPSIYLWAMNATVAHVFTADEYYRRRLLIKLLLATRRRQYFGRYH